MLRRLGPFHCVLVAFGILAAAQCAAKEIVLRAAFPLSYEPALASRMAIEKPCTNEDALCVRYRYTLGSDYQVLEWLQNGKVDAAVVSGMTLELVRRTLSDRFDRDFLVAAALPFNQLPLRRYRIALHGDREGLPLEDPEAELAALWQDMLRAPSTADIVVDVPSHLSAAVPELFARAQLWVNARHKADARNALDTIMQRLLGRLRFAAHGADGTSLRFVLAEEEGGALSHVFLVRRQALPEPLSTAESHMPPLDAERAFLDYLTGAAEKGAPEDELRRFAASNYVSENAGWRSRFRFAFTLDELHGILRTHATRDSAEDDGIALVLTGGGVKAAYQTKLIDHLYGNGYLRNRYAPGEPDRPSVPVKYVVGTSGGALLGIFVASLDGSYPHPDLSSKLWYRYEDGKRGEPLSSGDVFPAMDLLRWLSLVWCMVLFAAVCAVTSIYLRRRRGYAPATYRDEGARMWRVSLGWVALLAVTPWLIVYVNGKHGTEHIPAIQGAFYFLFLLVWIYSDNRLAVRNVPRAGKSPWPAVAAGAAGLGLTGAALLGDREAPPVFELPVLHFEITLPALIACFGVLLVCLAYHWYLVRCAPRLEPLPRDALPAFLLLAGVCVLSYVLLFALSRLGVGSLFELTVEFWVALGIIAVVVSVALAVLAYRRQVPWLRRRFDFLLAAHPSRCAERSHWITTARYSRMILFFTLGWAWWNFTLAPGLYGNDNAQRYFLAAARNVFGETKVRDDRSLEVIFRAYYAVPVTALEKGIERYVMFQPPQAYAGGAGGAPTAGYRSWLSISNDPRWLTIDDADQQRDLVMRVAFASGSPFPVFPAHRIALPLPQAGEERMTEELLVDGGYAHNVPVEAGKRLGARRVLVINSSPRKPAASAAQPEGRFRYVGNLPWMLRWIIPYLYERSQVEDALSAEDLIVALVAPSASSKGWPFLTDFRAEVIERMFDEARNDRMMRIGSIENWGRPAFIRRATAPAARSPGP